MRAVRLIARFFGWLLTPLVAWAASFLGAGLVSWLGAGWPTARGHLYLTIAAGGISAAAALFWWLGLLRRSRRLRETLQVNRDAIPVAAMEDK